MVEREIANRDVETQPFRTAMDVGGMESRLASVLDAAQALEIEISRLALSPAEVKIDGSAASQQAIEGLVVRLDGQGWVVPSETPVRASGGRHQFNLKGTDGHEG